MENVADLNHVGTLVIHSNYIKEETRIRTNSGNASYHSV